MPSFALGQLKGSVPPKLLTVTTTVPAADDTLTILVTS
jgi:hypothetical protein